VHGFNSVCANLVKRAVQSFKRSASLLICTRKKIFGWGLRIFCEWLIDVQNLKKAKQAKDIAATYATTKWYSYLEFY